MSFPRGRHPPAVLHRAVFLIGYVVRHKWYLLLERRRFNVPWQAVLAHDLDKFRPDYLWLWIVRDEVEQANRLHESRAPHKWEWWSDVHEPSGYRPMPDEVRREMLADWLASQRMQGDRGYAQRVVATYKAHREAVGLHPYTRAWVEDQLRAF